jgi:hypothetical protein
MADETDADKTVPHTNWRTVAMCALVVVAIIVAYQAYLDQRRIMALCSYVYAASGHAFMCW